MMITFTHPNTNDIRKVQTGPSLALFFFSSFFGIPWFLRGIKKIGWMIIAYYIFIIILEIPVTLLALVVKFSVEVTLLLYNIMVSIPFTIFAFWALIKGNEFTAKYYIEKGYKITGPDRKNAEYWAKEWSVPESVIDIPVNDLSKTINLSSLSENFNRIDESSDETKGWILLAKDSQEKILKGTSDNFIRELEYNIVSKTFRLLTNGLESKPDSITLNLTGARERYDELEIKKLPFPV